MTANRIESCRPRSTKEQDYAYLRGRIERLNDPEARFELGEDARRAELAALADRYLLELLTDMSVFGLFFNPK